MPGGLHVKTLKSGIRALVHRTHIGDYLYVFRLVVEFEIQQNPNWRGHIPNFASAVLRRLATSAGLSQPLVNLCRWSVYASVLQKRTIDFVLLHDLLKQLKSDISACELVDKEHIEIFWDGAEHFLTGALRAIGSLVGNDAELNNPAQVSAILGCLNDLRQLAPDHLGIANMSEHIATAFQMGAISRWSHLIGDQIPRRDDEGNIINVIRVCQLATYDLKMIRKNYEQIFRRDLKVSPFTIAYLSYDEQLYELAKPMAQNMTQLLQAVNTSEDEILLLAFNAAGVNAEKHENQDIERDTTTGNALLGNHIDGLHVCKDCSSHISNQNENISRGTSFYFSMQQFYKLSDHLHENEKWQVKTVEIYTWFTQLAKSWIEYSHYEALMRIGKAINIDNLKVVDAFVQCSSSAVDTSSVFYQIKKEWEILSWPDSEGAQQLAMTIAKNINRCVVFYIDVIRLKLDEMYSTSSFVNQPFTVSQEICTSVNSIMYVRQSIPELRREKIPLDLAKNASEEIDATLDDLFYSLAKHFEQAITQQVKTIIDAEVDGAAIDKLNSYICDQLGTLITRIEPNIFLRIFNIFKRRALRAFFCVLQDQVAKKRKLDGSPCQWKDLFGVIDNCFRLPDSEEDETDEKIIAQIRRIIKLHGG